MYIHTEEANIILFEGGYYIFRSVCELLQLLFKESY